MTMELLRGKAVRSYATAVIVGLTLAAPTVVAQPAVPPASPDTRARADDPVIPALLQQRDPTASTPVAVQQAAQTAGSPVMPAVPEDDYGPIRTLLLIFGGILLFASATAGLVLTIFALRRDLKRRKRAHRRRFQPLSRDSAIQAAHR